MLKRVASCQYIPVTNTDIRDEREDLMSRLTALKVLSQLATKHPLAHVYRFQ